MYIINNMVKPSSMGAIYTDTSAYRRNKHIDSVVKQLNDEMNTVKNDMNELKQHDDDFDTEFKTHIATSNNNFSIDNVNTIAKLFSTAINKINFTLNLIRSKSEEINNNKSYSSVLKPILETKYGEVGPSNKTGVILFTIAQNNALYYFFEQYPEFNNKYVNSLPEPFKELANDIDAKYYSSRMNLINQQNQSVYYMCAFKEYNYGVQLNIDVFLPDILQPGKFIVMATSIKLSLLMMPKIDSYETIPPVFNIYLQQLQDAFNSYEKIDYDPLLGTIYQFGLDENFNKLLVVSSNEYPAWKDKRIVDSYIPGSNIDMPGIIYQINVELNRNYTGMSEGEIVLVQYAVGATYYTGVVKMLRIEGYDGLCYQIQSININEIFPNSVSMTGDVAIQGNLNILRYNGESVINTDNTRKIVSFHDKVGINQQPYEVNGLLDIDNLTQQTVLDLFNNLVSYSVNTTDIIQIIRDDSSTNISSLFNQDALLFHYKNQCTVFSVPIKSIIDANDINIIHTDGYEVEENNGTINTGRGKSIITSDYSFTRLQQIVKEVNQMMPEFNKANDSSFVFSFNELLQSTNKKSYMNSMRAIIHIDEQSSEPRLIFVMSYLDVTDIVNDDSTGKPLLNVMNYMSKEFRFINYVSLLFKDTSETSGFYDASGNLAKDESGKILLQSAIQNHEYFSDRWGLLPESYIYAGEYDTGKLMLHEDKLHWNNQQFNDLWRGNVNIKNLSDYIDAQRKALYNNSINSSHVLSYFWNSFVKITCSNLIKVGIEHKERVIVVTSGFYLNTLLNQSMIVNGDNTISGNFFVNDSNNNNIFKVDNVKKTITNMYKVGIGMDEPETILDIKDTTVSDILAEKNSGIIRFNILNKIAARLRAVGNTTPFDTSTDFRSIIDSVYSELDVEQTIDNYVRLYELNMDTMLADDIVVLRQWLYPEWDGKKVGDIQDAANQFSIDFLKNNSQSVVDTEMIYDYGLIARFQQYIFGWRFTRGLFIEINGKMYLLTSSSNVQNFGLRPDSNTNITTFMNNCIRSNLKMNRIYIIMNSITPVNNVENLNRLKIANLENNDIILHSFILTVDMDDKKNTINNTTYQSITLSEDLTSVTLGDKTKIVDFTDDNRIAKYKNFWIAFNNNGYSENMTVGNRNVINYEDLYFDYHAGIQCTEISGNIFTLLCNELRIQDIIKPSLSVEGDAKITGDLMVTNKSTGENYVSIDPDNKYIGIGTDERFINYQDIECTTCNNIYTSQHNVYIKHDQYPVMVCERIRENTIEEDPDLNSFASYTGMTVKRKSELYDFKTIHENATKLHERVINTNRPDDTVTHMRYGPDISFEVCDKTNRSVELGQVQMSIDSVDPDTGYLKCGFGVAINDFKEGAAFVDVRRQLMYVDNDSTLYIKQINLEGKILSNDGSGNLLWGGKKLLTEE